MWFLSPYNSVSDQGLSKEEFHDLFLEIYADLCVYASRYVTDADASEDIVQEVLVTFWSENGKLRNRSLLKPYLFKSVKHKALNYIKRERRRSPLDELFDLHTSHLAIAENESAESYLSFSGLVKDLEEAVSQLPEQRQKIFRMSRFDMLKHREIAEQLNISEKTVETQIFRSLRFLRIRLKDYFD
jgi:RNA polymerase sigma-70 factor (ECF subfamily)